ncbi:MAG: hypothetical protein ACR2PA_06015 [Hyphomicrobiaceae bacterium]
MKDLSEAMTQLATIHAKSIEANAANNAAIADLHQRQAALKDDVEAVTENVGALLKGQAQINEDLADLRGRLGSGT